MAASIAQKTFLKLARKKAYYHFVASLKFTIKNPWKNIHCKKTLQKQTALYVPGENALMSQGCNATNNIPVPLINTENIS